MLDGNAVTAGEVVRRLLGLVVVLLLALENVVHFFADLRLKVDALLLLLLGIESVDGVGLEVLVLLLGLSDADHLLNFFRLFSLVLSVFVLVEHLVELLIGFLVMLVGVLTVLLRSGVDPLAFGDIVHELGRLSND